jgi:hypothetical protein
MTAPCSVMGPPLTLRSLTSSANITIARRIVADLREWPESDEQRFLFLEREIVLALHAATRR